MGKFNNKISAEFHPPKKWILERALTYTNKDIDEGALGAVGVACKNSKITCAKNFETDLASVPRAIWWLISPWDIARAAIIHDLLYKRIRQYREKNEKPIRIGSKYNSFEGNTYREIVVQNVLTANIYKQAKKASDSVFLMAMKDATPKVPKWKMYAAYYAVVSCGRWSIIPRDDD